MKTFILAMSCALTLIAAPLAAQTGSGSGSSSGSGAGTGGARGDQVKQEIQKKAAEAVEVTTKIAEAQGTPGPRFVRTLTNVQIELNLTDQLGTTTPEKKTVSMIASSGNWGKIRSAGTIRPEGDAPYTVVLNVDARPFVSVEGLIQLELTVEYAPLRSSGEQKEGARQRPTGINQSQTVVLQSGKALIVSQAADPISDRKVIVEVKGTILK